MHQFFRPLVLLVSALAANLTSAPLFPGNPVEVWIPSGPGIQWLERPGESPSRVLRVEVPQKTAKPWNVQVEARAPEAVPKGMVEIRFSMRTLKVDTSEGLSTVNLKLLTRPENEELGRYEARAGSEWRKFLFTGKISRSFPGEKVALAIMFGAAAQTVELADLSVRTLTESEVTEAAAKEQRQLLEAVRQRPHIQGLPPVAPGQRWAVTFQDEFDGKALDTSKWTPREGKRNDVMRSARAVTLDGQGALKMSIFREGTSNFDSWVDTEGKFQQTYGFFSARMKMQKSTGHWCAFWLQTPTTGHVDGSGRDGTEIDIMEKPWLTDEVNHALHWDGYGKEHKSAGTRSTTPGVMEGWHTFSLLWTPTNYVFYVDDAEVWRSAAGGVCQVPAHLRLTDEAAFSGWAGSVREATLPDAWYVDYVRVYALVDGKANPVMKP